MDHSDTLPPIPADILEAADAVLTGNAWNPLRTEAIARAIMAERERCAADLEIIAGKLVQRANDAFNGRDQGSAIILKSQADALTESAAAIRGGQS